MHTCVDAYKLAHEGVNVRRSVGVEGRRGGELMRRGGDPLLFWAPSLTSSIEISMENMKTLRILKG